MGNYHVCPQSGNDETTNLREHACKTKWYRLWDTVSKILINMEESKYFTMGNQPERKQEKKFRCGSIKHLRVSSKDCPVVLAKLKAKTLALGIGLSKSEAKKAA